MENYKKVQVVMLATDKLNKKNDICLFDYGLNIALKEDIGYPTQHLYFLSYEEIKEGDWVLSIWDNEWEIPYILSLKDSKLEYHSNAKKIIATTNPELYIHQKETISKPERIFYLPRPSNSFIQKYVEEYNKGNVITEVMVEYEIIDGKDFLNNWRNSLDKMSEPITKLRVAPDNTITIKRIVVGWSDIHLKWMERVKDDFDKGKSKSIPLIKWLEENYEAPKRIKQ